MRESESYVPFNTLRGQAILDERREAAEAFARKAAEEEKFLQEHGNRSRNRFNNDDEGAHFRAVREAAIEQRAAVPKADEQRRQQERDERNRRESPIAFRAYHEADPYKDRADLALRYSIARGYSHPTDTCFHDEAHADKVYTELFSDSFLAAYDYPDGRLAANGQAAYNAGTRLRREKGRTT